MNVLLAFFLTSVYNITLLVGTVYLVQYHDWNPWWFLLTVALMSHGKYESEK